MTGMLKVSTSELRAAASNFSSTGGEISNLTSNMLSLIAGISGTIWQGEAQSTYLSRFAALDADIQKLMRMIQEHVDDLNTMADEYDRAEQQNQQEASALESGII